MIRYRKGIQISGLIYFHRISDATPMEGTPLRNWCTFEKICGDRFSKVVLATTNVDDDVGGRREQQLGDFWRANIARGWSMQRFLRDRRSAADVLAPILEHVTKRPLQLQKEISDLHLSLVQTSAARVLFLQLQACLRDCQREHDEIERELANHIMDKQHLTEVIEKLRKSNRCLKRVKGGLYDLKKTRAEHVREVMLRTPILGPILRSVCLPSLLSFVDTATRF